MPGLGGDRAGVRATEKVMDRGFPGFPGRIPTGIGEGKVPGTVLEQGIPCAWMELLGIQDKCGEEGIPG